MITAKMFRLHPLSWNGGIIVCAELLGCPASAAFERREAAASEEEGGPISYAGATKQAAGVFRRLVGTRQGKILADASITASTGRQHVAQSRLDADGWCPAFHDHDQWLQFAFPELTSVELILTRGSTRYAGAAGAGYVSQFQLSYTVDGTSWYQHPQVLVGNEDGAALKANAIAPPVRARRMRIHPLEWGGVIALRAELLGRTLGPPALHQEMQYYFMGEWTDCEVTAVREDGACLVSGALTDWITLDVQATLLRDTSAQLERAAAAEEATRSASEAFEAAAKAVASGASPDKITKAFDWAATLAAAASDETLRGTLRRQYNGRWRVETEDASQDLFCRIAMGQVSFVDDTVSKIVASGEDWLAIVVDGEVLFAQMVGEFRLRWSDGDQWVLDPFAGRWYLSGVKGDYCDVKGNKVLMPDGSTNKLTVIGRDEVTMCETDKAFFGRLAQSDSRLEWSDGDVWARTPEDAQAKPDRPTADAQVHDAFKGIWWLSPESNAEICQDSIIMPDGTMKQVFPKGRYQITTVDNGEPFFATLKDDDTRLEWDSGAYWTRDALSAQVSDPFAGTWWLSQDLDDFAVISGEAAHLKDGSVLQVYSAGPRKITAELEGETIHGTLVRGDKSISWSDGDVWTRDRLRANPVPDKAPAAQDPFAGVWWVDQGDGDRFARIEGETLRMPDGAETKVYSEAENEITIILDGYSRRGSLTHDGKRLKWNDGRLWARERLDAPTADLADPFEGTWWMRGGASAHITGESVKMPDGTVEEIYAEGEGQISMIVGNRPVIATLAQGGKVLSWDDGNQWTRERSHAATASGVAPAR